MAALVSSWLERFAHALEGGEEEVVQVFGAECYWRDIVAFTWNIKTMEGHEAIRDMVRGSAPRAQNWALKGEPKEDSDGRIEAWLTFETEQLNCVGHVRLNEDGTSWTLTTIGDELKGYPEPCGPKRSEGRPYGSLRNRVPISRQAEEAKAALGAKEQPFVVIVGGSQCGLALAARLQRLNVPNIVLDSNPQPGDSWRNRYDCLHLHDPVFANHLPHLPMPDHWPLWPHKDQMADWLDIYARVMEVNFWGRSTCLSSTWDATQKHWTVKVDRNGEEVTLRPKHLVLATGLYGSPYIPNLSGQDTFPGDVLHSSVFVNGKKYQGKKAVVVGSNTSAHDIAEDLWECGAEVTMVQRSPTMIIHIDTQLKTVFGLHDDEAKAKGITTEEGDLISTTYPFKVVTELQKKRCQEIRETDADYYKKLEAAGFRLDFGEDETANIMMFLRRGAGYYFDTGASDLIIRKEVKLQQGDVKGFTPGGRVLLGDGTELEADVVVLGTGYRPLNDTVSRFLGKDVTEKLGRVWGLGSGFEGDPGPWEGELRNMWKPTAVEHLWVQGGNLGFSRNYSKYLALQLQARFLGLPTPVYGAPSAAIAGTSGRGLNRGGS
ncbi:unnamed protein product [Durusdinium trenchii]|uniref:FAD/NAD(P)-binding domain-containing protein n=1 Tax=Durusdinium trenchii TaxID=1381693 RepID=A0ABP0QQX0_9DINO